MEVLEKLYLSAEANLGQSPLRWGRFMTEFAKAFSAHATLYHISFETDLKTVKQFESIASSAPETTRRYIDAELYKHHQIAETDLAPLEPNLRSDIVSDEHFRKLGPLADFLIENGMFYQLMVPAILADTRFAGLLVWRNEVGGDFSAVEKQRLSLFMRHLIAIVDASHLSLIEPSSSISVFGSKWDLTITEIAVLDALLQGFSLKEIASRSGRSYGTVRWHVQNILEKCQVSSQKGLLREFYQLIQK